MCNECSNNSRLLFQLNLVKSPCEVQFSKHLASIQLVEYVIIRWYGMTFPYDSLIFFLMSMQSLSMSPPPRLGESKFPRSEEFTFPLRESLSIDRAWLSAASMDLAISLAFWSVSLPLTASSFLRRSCDRHLSINWSRTFSSSLVLQFSLSWNNLVTNWSVVSDKIVTFWYAN